MKSFKLTIQLILLAMLAASMTACGGKNKKSGVGRAVRTSPTTPYTPNTGGGGQYSGECHNLACGEFTNFSRQALLALMGLQEGEIGEVSPYSNQQTGVRFYGQIDQYGRGYLGISVFDSFFTQNPGIGPFEPLTPYTCQGRSVGNGSLQLDCQGGLQPITLYGYETQNGEFVGQVYFGGNNSLGQFRISSCGFLGC